MAWCRNLGNCFNRGMLFSPQTFVTKSFIISYAIITMKPPVTNNYVVYITRKY